MEEFTMNDEKMMEILRDVVLVVDVECIILTTILDFFVFDAVWQAISSVAILVLSVITLVFRSEERRVGKECGS